MKARGANAEDRCRDAEIPALSHQSVTAPVRILLSTSSYYPHIGGVEEVAQMLALHLSNLGHEVVVATNRYPHSLAEREHHDGVEIRRFDFIYPTLHPAILKNGWRAIPGLVKYLQFVRTFNPGIVHVVCPGPNAFYTFVARRFRKFPLVVSLHGETFADNGGLYQKSAFARWALTRLLDLSDAVTGASRYVLEDTRRRFSRDLKNAEAIYGGIEFTEEPTASSQSTNEPYVFACGRLVANKGFACLIRAFAQVSTTHPNLHLRIAGGGEEFAALTLLVSELGLTDRIHLIGEIKRQDRAELIKQYRSCLFFVCPSPIESFGLACLEAMREGKPVIAPNRGGPPEFIRHETDGLLVDTTDQNAIASSIMFFLHNPAAIADMGESAYKQARLFKIDTMLGKYFNVYQRTCPSLQPNDR